MEKLSWAESRIGGNPENQKEFLDLFHSDAPKRPQERNRRKPPVANEFALGYTYYDVLDADQDGKIPFQRSSE